MPNTTKPYTDASGECRELDDEWAKTAKRGRPKLRPEDRKVATTIMLDPDLIEAAKQEGETEKGWQTRLNDAARKGLGLGERAPDVAKKA